MSPLRRVKAKIGELLVQKRLITHEQLQLALSLQRKQGKDKRLGEILLESGYITREELSLALAVQFGYPYIKIGNCTIKQEILSLLPREIVLRFQVLPIDRIEDVLTVAMVNPLDKLAIDQMQKLTQSSVKVFLTTPMEIKEILQRYYR
jgi:type IV pilus assembly protein PilB